MQGEQADYGSVASDFSLLLLIASIVWKASCGKRATHGYYTRLITLDRRNEMKREK